jgi:tetratricopeptide (TPR) repeat protein
MERHQALVSELQQRMVESLKTHDEQVAPLLLTHLLTAQRLAEERQQWDRVLGLMMGTDEALGIFGYWGARKDLLQRALNAAQKGTDRKTLSSVLNQLGLVAESQGDYDSARKYYQDSVVLDRELGDRSGIAKVLGNLGNVALLQGDYDAARKSYQQSLDLAQALGDRQLIATILLNLGNVAQSQGDYDAARKSYQQSLDLAQALGDRYVIARVLWGQATVSAKMGQKAEARKLLDQAIQIFARLGDPALADAQKHRAALGNAPDPVQCRKTCDDLQAKGELAVSLAKCVQKLCAD